MLGELFRREGFWLLDTMKGSPIRNHAKELDEIYLKRIGNPEALEELLRHAIATVPFYGKIAIPDISFFPVVSKKEYRADFDSFRSKDYLKEDELHKVFTSGSTGTPFMAYQDREKIRRHQAGLINLNRSIGWNLGAKFLFFRVWGVSHGSNRLSQLMSNTVPVDVINFNDEKKETIRQRLLRDKSLHLILGYASAIESLTDYLAQYHETYGIKLIISDSENLSATAKAKMEEVFQCPVLNRYGNNENGIIALTRPGDDRMHVNFPEYYVELLDLDSDEPVALGKPGRIVITDLYNKAFPFIRYDTGDIGIADEMYGSQCMVLKEFVGRVSAVLRNVSGERIGEATVTAYFENLVGLKRYQVAQTMQKQYKIRVENEDNALDGLLVQRAKAAFGEDAEIVISHVAQIPQAKNGKYKITSCEVEDKP